MCPGEQRAHMQTHSCFIHNRRAQVKSTCTDKTLTASRDHVPLRLPGVHIPQGVQTQCRVLHMETCACKKGREGSHSRPLPRKIPSQQGRHRLEPSSWGRLCLCQVVWPLEQSQNLWSRSRQVPHSGLLPPHSLHSSHQAHSALGREGAKS